MPFDELVGNRAIVGRLARMARTGSVPPSLLFSGPAGVGKLKAATTLAQALNCTNQAGDACGRCASCLRIARNEHPDVRALRPEGAGRQLKAESVRRVVSETPFRPFEGRRRISIFVDAERMNPTAANTLLKTLEEPPPWAVLILVTANAAALLPTILSRCQAYRFAPLAIEELTGLLVAEHDMNPEQATLRAALSGGSLAGALELTEAPLAELRREALRIAGVLVAGGKEQDLVPWADQLSKNDGLQLLLTMLMSVVRDAASALGGGAIVHRDLTDEITQLSETRSLSTWIRAYQLAEEALLDLRDRYLNKRLTMSRLLAELAALAT